MPAAYEFNKLERENTMLRNKLKELTAINEGHRKARDVLLRQNAELEKSLKYRDDQISAIREILKMEE